jgi:hypothetical protein
MKTSLFSTILCLALIPLCGSPCATARAAEDATDLELRSLLAGEPVKPSDPVAPPVVAEQVRQAAASRAADASSNATTSHDESTRDQAHWTVKSGSNGETGAADSNSEGSAPSLPINPVPEPSAIILAVAALGYFLLFARRRRV